MEQKVRFEQEYIVNASISVIYPMLSTPSGLSDWFADDVNINGKTYTFFWDGAEQIAELIAKRTNVFARFKWIEDDDPKAYFEFKLTTDELTNEVALVITDFAEKEEVEDAKELWDTQVDKLKHNLGI
ncbi:START-like domain-containing protein [Saccharicrinis sp. FJH62]|uniref:START-like domain-containing protein n=1 Tax=Saccharicrinis sp. FJH62 TaxID=3344657 RepID=UPI0035D47E60